jgi:hypothetical protein
VSSHLATSLSAAVPLWVEEFVQKGMSLDEVFVVAKGSAQVIAEKGDLILFRSKKHGETASAFNALAKGIAALSFVPGGVTTFGQHFETDPSRLSATNGAPA